jgi:hypothetical protein
MRSLIKEILDKQKPHYKEKFVNENFDKPFNTIRKVDEFTYTCGDEKQLIKYNFRPSYSKIGCHQYLKTEPNKVYELSWNWLYGVDGEDKTTNNWVKSTTSGLSIIDRFIRDVNPNIIFFNETEQTSIIYRGVNFLDKIKNIFSHKFLVCSDFNSETNSRKIYLIKKELTTYDDDKITKTHEQCGGDYNVIRERILFPKKRNLTGIKRKNFNNQQLRRIIYSEIYLGN